MTSLIILTIATLIESNLAVDIGLQDICGNKLVGSCPSKISLKVVGGDSSCAEKVPWNVLVELVTGPKIKAAGKRNHSTLSLSREADVAAHAYLNSSIIVQKLLTNYAISWALDLISIL